MATVIALFAAHMVGDFLLQPSWMVRNKHRLHVFTLHIAITAILTVFFLGGLSTAQVWIAASTIVLSHALLDGLKTLAMLKGWLAREPRSAFIAFIADQAGHIFFIVLAAIVAPEAFASGLWTTSGMFLPGAVLSVFAIGAGAIAATRAGEFMIALFMQRFVLPSIEKKDATADNGLVAGGAWIGLLERSLIFLLILIGQFEAIGYLLAAKSILRFQYAKDRSHSEYVIIGTLASFSWAIGLALITQTLLSRIAGN
ncbi:MULTISPECIES: DUF3307 domain-containing protein [Hyphobacterium]|uniref:DUF3307 domain-containing protein n=1 Tax=Hyphobacterium vulgare TaxID=1736751 RepID=A0ABV6ZU10_9PROT